MAAVTHSSGWHGDDDLVAILQGRRLRRCDAQDIADELIDRCRRLRTRCALFVLPDRQCRVAPCDSYRFGTILLEHPMSLCGVYTEGADRGDLVDDIRARCEMLGFEWFDA